MVKFQSNFISFILTAPNFEQQPLFEMAKWLLSTT